jgi:hypothetical protein
MSHCKLCGKEISLDYCLCAEKALAECNKQNLAHEANYLMERDKAESAEATRVMLTNAPADLRYLLDRVERLEKVAERAKNCGYCGNGSCRGSDKGCFDCPIEPALAALEQGRG